MKRASQLLLLSAFFLIPLRAQACTVPVFRYALENWDLTAYEVIVFHRGPLPADVDMELKAWSVTPSKANIDITIVDLDEEVVTNAQRNLINLWKRTADKRQTPWLVVRHPSKPGVAPFAWHGDCTSANLRSILQSPLRQAIVAHLTRGDSTVFVLLTSGDRNADAETFEMASSHLQLLEKRIKLPVQTEEGGKLVFPLLPLRLSLPILVLDRDDPAEAAFIQTLLATEDGLDQVKGPILFPIFGRGRMLASIRGAELNEESIYKVSVFLCGSCSCTVKDQNPGTDLLLAYEWNAVQEKLFEGKEAVAMPMHRYASLPGRDPIAMVTELHMSTESEECFPCRLWLWISTGIAFCLVLLSGIWLFCTFRKRRSQ